jgi:dihydrolipoamide dehydrogenase
MQMPGVDMNQFDVIILGGGPSGTACAVRLAQAGFSVAIVERDWLGGICTNWGCTPSKTMLESARVARLVRESIAFGVISKESVVQFGRVAERRDRIIEESRFDISTLLSHYGIAIFQGEGELLSRTAVRVHHGKLEIEGTSMELTGETTDIQAHTLVLATGSAPLFPDSINPNEPSIVNSNRLISVRTLPDRLTIIGGGVFGLEFATLFSSFGCKVTIVESANALLYRLDPDISSEIKVQLERNGVKVLLRHSVMSIKNGLMKIKNLETDTEIDHYSDRTLVAIGRKPVLNEQALDQIGVDFALEGIYVNPFMQTNVDGVWAIGDATGKSVFAHAGIEQGVVCAENIIALEKGGDLREMRYDVIPALIYTVPEIAAVGEVPEDLEGVSVVKVPFQHALRALIENCPEGFLKIWARDNRIIAAQCMGNGCTEICQSLTYLIALGIDIRQASEVMCAYPTYSGVVRTAMDLILGKAIDYFDTSGCKPRDYAI